MPSLTNPNPTAAGGSAGTRGTRATAVAPMRPRPNTATTTTAAVAPLNLKVTDAAVTPSVEEHVSDPTAAAVVVVDRFKSSSTFTTVVSPRGSPRSSLDGLSRMGPNLKEVASGASEYATDQAATTECIDASASAPASAPLPRTAPAVLLGDGKSHVESLLMCPALLRANSSNVISNDSSGTGPDTESPSGTKVSPSIRRTYTGNDLETLSIPVITVSNSSSTDTDDEDEGLTVFDGMDIWNGMGVGMALPTPGVNAHTPASAEVAAVTGGHIHDGGVACSTPKCVFHTLTPDMTPHKMMSRAGSMASSHTPSGPPSRTPSAAPGGVPARGSSPAPTSVPAPFSARAMSLTVSASNKMVFQSSDDATSTSATGASGGVTGVTTTANATSAKRPSTSTGGGHVRAPSPNPSNTSTGHIRCPSPNLNNNNSSTNNSNSTTSIQTKPVNPSPLRGGSLSGKPAVLTAGELNARHLSSTKPPSPSRTRGQQASPTRTVRNGTTMVTAGAGPSIRYDEVTQPRIPGSGITRGNGTPNRSSSAGRRNASPSMSSGRGGGVGSRGGGGGGVANDDITDDPVFHMTPATNKKKKKAGAGAAGDGDARDEGDRLSLNTLIRQCDILKKITGLSEEDIEWTAVKDNTGAYKHAANKQAKAEDNYFKSVYEMELYSVVKKYINTSGSCKLYTLLQSMISSSDVFYINPTDANEVNKIEREKAELMDLLTSSKSPIMAMNLLNCQPNTANPTIMSDRLHKALIDAVEQSKEHKDIPRKLKLVLTNQYAQECKEVVDRFHKSEALNNDSCQEMEKWEKRKIGTKEYLTVQKEAEVKWLAAEESANKEALQTMRSYLTPIMLGNAALGIGSLTLAEFNTLVLDNEGVFSQELMVELKNNKCLHWCIKHIDDIANASFLSGESKAYFESLETYDIIECRALVEVLKDLTKFNNDQDGKKMEWRDRVFTKCKSMIDQFNGVEVKGPWNAKEGKRAMIKLPPLKPEQLRRPVYYHKTYKQYLAKLKQYDDKIALLARKESMAAAAKIQFDDAVSEWNTLLAELRDDKLADLLTTCSKEQIADLKREASATKLMTEKKYKMLQLEVANLRKTIDSNPVSRAQFVQAKEHLEAFLLRQPVDHVSTTNDGTDVDVDDSNSISIPAATPTPYCDITSPSKLLIVGVFDREPLIEKSEVSSGAKFLSPEEEAAQRQLEIQGLKVGSCSEDDNGSNSSISDDSSGNCSPVPPSTSSTDGSSCKTPGKISRVFTDALEKNAAAASGVSSVSGAGNKTPARRASILDSFNSAHLNSISNSIMKSQHAGGIGVGGESSTCLSPVPMKMNAGASGIAAADSTIKPTVPTPAPKDLQSKLLKRMMGVKDETTAGDAIDTNGSHSPLPLSPMRMFGGATGGGGLSFLDQIKQGKMGKSQPATPMGGGGGAPMSLLDQIRMGKPARTPATAALALNLPETPSDLAPLTPPPRALSTSPLPMKPMSFLDEIRAKAMKDC